VDFLVADDLGGFDLFLDEDFNDVMLGSSQNNVYI
jgi:hypothetical protein